MAGFVPKDKLSKKAQKELNRQRRTMWNFSPVSRTVDSKKLYNRKKRARDRYDETAGICGKKIFGFMMKPKRSKTGLPNQDPEVMQYEIQANHPV